MDYQNSSPVDLQSFLENFQKQGSQLQQMLSQFSKDPAQNGSSFGYGIPQAVPTTTNNSFFPSK
jgi:hypothetical protein